MEEQEPNHDFTCLICFIEQSFFELPGNFIWQLPIFADTLSIFIDRHPEDCLTRIHAADDVSSANAENINMFL